MQQRGGSGSASPQLCGSGARWPRTFFVLDLGLHVVDGVAGLHLQRDGLPRQRLDEDLSSTKRSAPVSEWSQEGRGAHNGGGGHRCRRDAPASSTPVPRCTGGGTTRLGRARVLGAKLPRWQAEQRSRPPGSPTPLREVRACARPVCVCPFARRRPWSAQQSCSWRRRRLPGVGGPQRRRLCRCRRCVGPCRARVSARPLACRVLPLRRPGAPRLWRPQ